MTVAEGFHRGPQPGTRCMRGHLLTPENVYVKSNGRQCKECQRSLDAERHARHVGPLIRTDLIRPLLDEWLRRGNRVSLLSPRCAKVAWRVRNHPLIALTSADALLCAIDRQDAWHVELADLYEASS